MENWMGTGVNLYFIYSVFFFFQFSSGPCSKRFIINLKWEYGQFYSRPRHEIYSRKEGVNPNFRLATGNTE